MSRVDEKCAANQKWSKQNLSGIDAVRKIVETEAQARAIVEEARKSGEKIIAEARQQAERSKQEARSRAERERQEILSQARVTAEAEARKSDLETEQLLQRYRQLADERKDIAVRKAVELILGA